MIYILFTFIALIIIFTIVVFTKFKAEYTKWSAGIALTGALGGLSESIYDNFIPYFSTKGILTPSLEKYLIILHDITFFICHNGVVYTYIIFAIVFSGFYTLKTIRLLKFILLIPVSFTFIITPFKNRININFKVMAFWAIPYIVVATYLLMKSYYIESNPLKKRNRKLTNTVTIVPCVFVLFSNYLARALGYNDLFRYNVFIILIEFIMFLIFVISDDGFIGVKLKFENKVLDSTIKAVNSGTAILNHTIKNEIIRISMCAENIKLRNPIDETYIHENSNDILDASQHILDMMSRIQNQIKGVELKNEINNLVYIINKSIDMVSPFLLNKNIKIIKNFPNTELNLICDQVHLKESFFNILKNSIEAITNDNGMCGIITINIYSLGKKATVTINDNGKGISENNMPYIFDPFFSTKKIPTNYGLGLSYCYNVMRKHNGTLFIESKESAGTTVYLDFPISKKG